MRRILFVCLGNICRSPAAEGVTRHLAKDAGLDIEVDSAGTGDWHVGDPPHPPMVAAAEARGIDLSDQRGRQVGPEDFARFDLILAMDARNQATLEDMRPAGDSTPVRLFLDDAEVPDPYYTDDYDAALDLVEDGARRLIAYLQSASA